MLKTLQSIQSELKAPKNQVNKFGGYSYRSCEDILEAVKPILAKYGAVITITDDLVLIGERYYVKATATLKTDKAEFSEIFTTAFAREEESEKGKSASQITGSASSYARKYALNGLLLIDDTKDADYGGQPDHKPEPKQAKASQNDSKKAKVNELCTIIAKHDNITPKAVYDEVVAELGTNDMNAVIDRLTELTEGKKHG